MEQENTSGVQERLPVMGSQVGEENRRGREEGRYKVNTVTQKPSGEQRTEVAENQRNSR